VGGGGKGLLLALQSQPPLFSRMLTCRGAARRGHGGSAAGAGPIGMARGPVPYRGITASRHDSVFGMPVLREPTVSQYRGGRDPPPPQPEYPTPRTHGIAVPLHHGITAAQYHGVTASRYHCITASRHHGITRYHGTTAAQYHGIAAAQYRGVTASTP
jgi:hypothetical protein